MFCQKCGYKLEEGDLFCENCGTKVNHVEESVEIKEENITSNSIKENNIANAEPKVEEGRNQNKKSSKKVLIILGGIIALIIGFIALGTSEKSIDLTAKEYFELEANGELEQYYGKTLNITGFLFVDTRADSTSADEGYYGIVENKDKIFSTSLDDIHDFNMAMFKYEGELAEDIGMGSEIKVTCKYNKETFVLEASAVEVLVKEEPMFFVEIADLIEKNDRYIGKKVYLSGRLVNFLGDGHYLYDIYGQNCIRIKGMTEKEFVTHFNKGNIVTVTAVFDATNEGTSLEIVEFIQQDGIDSIKDVVSMSVSDCIAAYFNTYEITDGDLVSVYGKFETNMSYSNPMVLSGFSGDILQFIRVEGTLGVDLTDYMVSNQDYILYGYITEGGTGLDFEVIAIG